MYILGISAYYHDSAAVLVKNGKVICAVEEERFTRLKHDNSFPINAVRHCLKFANIKIEDVNHVAYYEKPLLKFERILQTFLETFPFSLSVFLKGIPEWLNYKIKIGKIIEKNIGFKGKIFYIPHHLSHAACSYFTSSFENTAILTIDGVGDYPTTGLWIGKRGEIKPLKMLNFPDSLGLFYSTLTSFLGFGVNSDEYKVMGLSAYGKPKYFNKMLNMLDVKEDGSFKLNMNYFSFRESFTMWSKKTEKVFGKPRKHGDRIRQRDKNLASSLQKVTEQTYFKILNHLYEITNTKNLCVSGGVALNSLANGKIYTNTPFRKVHIFGAAGDSGASLGAALYVYHSILGNKKRTTLGNLYLGGINKALEIRKALKNSNLKYEKINNSSNLINKVALELSNNKIIGWYVGRMEFGPRALGARSILANPNLRKMKDKVNKIKMREEFRPFAASVLQEKVHDFFEVPENKHYSPFMNFCFKAKPSKRKLIAAVVHKDGTCRIQTVNKNNGLYYQLIKRFFQITGIPCVLNTSYNLSTEPIVNTPEEAIKDFLHTSMDYLVMGNYFITKD